MATLSLTVQGNNDDAEETQQNTGFTASATSVRMHSNTSASGRYFGGFRFTGVNIPRGSTINSVTLGVVCIDTSNDDPSVTLHFEAHDNSPDFATNADLFNRVRTTGTTSWIATGLGAFVRSQSPNFASHLQQVIDRSGWIYGNAVTVVVMGRNAASSAFRVTSRNGSSTDCATLEIDFTPPVRPIAGADDWEHGSETGLVAAAGTRSFSTSAVRAGSTRSFRTNPTAGTGYGIAYADHITGPAPRALVAREEYFWTFTFRVDTFPAAYTSFIHLLNLAAGATAAAIQIDNTGQIRGSGSTNSAVCGTVKLSLWNTVRLRCTANGTSYVSLQTGSDGTFSAEQSFTANNADMSYVIFGVNTGTPTLDIYHGPWVCSNTGFRGAFFQVTMLRPNGAGNDTAWTGTFADVDEDVKDDDTSYITATTATNAETVALQSCADRDIRNCTIVGVVLLMYAKAITAGSIQVRARFASTNYDSADVAMTTSYAQYRAVYSADPADATALTTGDLDAMEMGAEHVSGESRITWMAALVVWEPATTAFNGSTNEAIVIDGRNTASSLASAGDPTLFRNPDDSAQWKMAFSSGPMPLGSGLNIYEASLPTGQHLDAAVGNWSVNGTAIISKGAASSWDELAVETPDYVEGYDHVAEADVKRIYYAGYNDFGATDGEAYIYIGCAQWNGSAWVKVTSPYNPASGFDGLVYVATEDWEKYPEDPGGEGWVLEPTVYYDPDGEQWHMWYTAGEQRYKGHVVSTDGINWTTPTQFGGALSSWSPTVAKPNGFEFFTASIFQTGALSGIHSGHSAPHDVPDNVLELTGYLQRVSVLSALWHWYYTYGMDMAESNGKWMLYYTGRDPLNTGIVSIGRAEIPIRQIAVPNTATITITPFAPSVKFGVAPTPGVLAVTTTRFTPVVSATQNVRVTPGVLAVSTARFTPLIRLNKFARPGTASIVTNRFTPIIRLNKISTPGVLAVSTTRFTPTVRTPRLVTPGVLAVTTNRLTPSVLAPRLVTPGVASIVTNRFTPTVVHGHVARPGTLAITTSRFAPTVSAPRVVTPGVLAVVTNRLTPTVLTPTVAVPGPGSLTLTAFDPIVTAESGNDIVVTPGVLAVVLNALTPTVATPIVARPGVLEVETLRFAPAVRVGIFAVPGPGSMVTTRFAPSVLTPVVVRPGIANVNLLDNEFPGASETDGTSQFGTGTLTKESDPTAPVPSREVWKFETDGSATGVQWTPAMAVTNSHLLMAWVRRSAGSTGTWQLCFSDNSSAATISLNGGAWQLVKTVGNPGALRSLRIRAVAGATGEIYIQQVHMSEAMLQPQVPSVSNTLTVIPGTASMVTTRFVPTVLNPRSIVPGTGAIVTARFTPVVRLDKRAVPGTASIITTRFIPQVLTPRHVVPGPGSIVTNRFTPTVLLPKRVIPGTAAITITRLTPGVFAGQTIRPGTLAVIITRFVPTVIGINPGLAVPGTASIVLTGYPPVVIIHRYISLEGGVVDALLLGGLDEETLLGGIDGVTLQGAS